MHAAATRGAEETHELLPRSMTCMVVLGAYGTVVLALKSDVPAAI